MLHGFKEIDPVATLCTLPNEKIFDEDGYDADNEEKKVRFNLKEEIIN